MDGDIGVLLRIKELREQSMKEDMADARQFDTSSEDLVQIGSPAKAYWSRRDPKPKYVPQTIVTYFG